MSKYYASGGLLLLSGLLLTLYQAISSMMTAGEIVWKRVKVKDIIGAKCLAWIDSMSIESIQGAFQYFISLNVTIVLIVLGVVLLIIGGFAEK